MTADKSDVPSTRKAPQLKTFKEFLAWFLKKRKMSQSKLANIIGVQPSYVSQLLGDHGFDKPQAFAEKLYDLLTPEEQDKLDETWHYVHRLWGRPKTYFTYAPPPPERETARKKLEALARSTSKRKK